ncbi:MAG: cytochrome P450 [Nocardiopsaceae bacterium]|jgi:cytochrome P450|nr:cytochrome P450 [Nocardiopsaceae bacterium]
MLQRIQQDLVHQASATRQQDRTGRDAGRPPGPRGADAFRTLRKFATGRPLEASTSLFAKYGDTVYVPVRPWEGLYVFSRPAQAEHVLAANQDNYVKPFPYRPLRLMLGNGLVTAEDPLWRRHRRIIQPVFSSRNVASFAAEMDAGAQRAVQRWNGSQTVELATEMSGLTLDVVGRVLFGADLAGEAQPLRRALAGGQWLGLLGAFMPIPAGPAFSRMARAAAQRFGAGSVQQQVENLIARRLGQPGSGGEAAGEMTAGGLPDGHGPRDLLALLAAARDSDGNALSMQEIRDEIATFLVAGHETTAMALTWSLALLSAYPQARERLEEEVDAVLGDGPADPGMLPWTTAVVSEAMRLYPPAWTLERTAVADDDVCGTKVPAGSMVAVQPYLIHRNPAVWPNPAGFDPARFLPGAPERHRYAFIPFGGGKRGCIGAGFARQEAVLVLARLCRRYRLDLVGSGLPRARGFITLRPGGPVAMRLTRRT